MFVFEHGVHKVNREYFLTRWASRNQRPIEVSEGWPALGGWILARIELYVLEVLLLALSSAIK
jgi:hypothetical protein